MAHRKLALCAVVALVTSVVLPTSAQAATISVTCPGDSLQAAIDDADSGDTIEVAAGTCLENIQVSKDLTINGQGRGQTFLDAGDSGTVVRINDADVTINGVTVTGGDSYGGGGIFLDRGTLDLRNSRVSGNFANWGGGLAALAGTTATLRSVTIEGNQALFDAGVGGGNGGGINSRGTLTVEDSVIRDNEARHGGGLWLHADGLAALDTVTFSGNVATTGDGGGIFNAGFLQLADATVSSNHATAGDGGGIYQAGGVLLASDTAISSNAAGSDGGGLYLDDGNAHLTASTVEGNTAIEPLGVGGGAYLAGANLTIRNGTVSGNTAANAGGGIAVGSTAELSMFHATFTNNSANDWGGGGIAINGIGNVTAQATIIATNNATSGPDCRGALQSDGHNLIGNTSSCTVVSAHGTPPGLSDRDARLGPLQDNGGKTLTHALLAASPARDFIADCSPITTDQRGVERPVGSGCDIGAVEDAAPVASPDIYSVQQGGTLTVSAPGILDNDTDLEGATLSIGSSTAPSHGTLSLDSSGSFRYEHDGSDATADTFRYRAFDGKLMSPTALVTVTVTPPSDHTLALVDVTSGRWHLRDADGVVTSFFFGDPGDVPVMGDWDCDGIDTPGLFRVSDAYAYLRNSNTQGIADIRFFFGNPSDIPLAGDFNGDGCDTLSVYRPSEQRFFIMNELGENEGGLGAADHSFLFGNPGDKPVVGDWDGDGVDEIGLHRESSGFFYFRNTLDTGIASSEFFFGDPGDRFVAADWDGTGYEKPAVFRPSNATCYFRYSLTPGVADHFYVWGEAAWLPAAGRFGP